MKIIFEEDNFNNNYIKNKILLNLIKIIIKKF